MITELNFAKLTPAAWAIANHNEVDVGVGRSMLLHNLREGREMNAMAELPDEFTPDWTALGAQYNATAPEERAGVMSASNVWHRVCEDNCKALVELWLAKDYRGMVDLVGSAADPGPVGNLCIDGVVKASAGWAGYGLTWDATDIRMEVVPGAKAGRIYVTLGQFSIIRLERDAQLLMPVYDYCMPEKECTCGGCEDDPCEIFRHVKFPVNEFFPPNSPAPIPDNCRDLKSCCG